MAQRPEPRYCPECSSVCYVESLFCNLYKDDTTWVERARGDIKATLKEAKARQPRQLLTGRVIGRYCV
eukprot:11183594-Lingulodinium_polyedra.AAC.1